MIRSEILQDLSKILKKLDLPVEALELEHPANIDFGDYSTNIALRVKKVGVSNPQDLANLIINTWRNDGLPEYLSKIDVISPGFINLFLKDETLITQTEKVLKEKGDFGRLNLGQGKTVVIDYSAPNIAKPFGIGHLRSTNIGQAIYNLYEFLGWKVIGDNHLGDWGTQFGKLIFMIDKRLETGDLRLRDLTIEKLEKLYVEFHKKAEKKPELEEEARRWFKRLEEGDEKATKIWQACIEISLKEYQRIYDLLNVHIDHAYGESYYREKAMEVLSEAKAKNLVSESQGAQVIEIPGMKVPAMLLKSDEGTTYLLRDLATIKFRKEKWQPDLIVYEVGADQKFHFQQIFACAEMLGYGKKNQFVHVAHGLIRWSGGKFSTRKGQTIHLDEVLSEAILKAKKIIEKSETDKGLKVREKEEISQKVGIAAVKYSDLKQNPQTDIIFDWDQIFSLEGNSGPYLQYVYARCFSLLVKAGEWKWENGSEKLNSEARSGKLETEERDLMRMIYRFPEVIEEAAYNFSPNLLTNFLFDLAQRYNLLYNKLPILNSHESRDLRLALTAATAQVLKNGLGILGIETLERM